METGAAASGSPAVFSRHQELVFPYISPGTRYNLPFFLHRLLGDVLLADRAGTPLRVCEDTVYEALDHRLVWLDYDGLTPEERNLLKDASTPRDKSKIPAEGRVQISLYFGRVDDHGSRPPCRHPIADDVSREGPPLGGAQSCAPPDVVLLMADFFRAGEPVAPSWEAMLPTSFAVCKCPTRRPVPASHRGPTCRALRLDPGAPGCTQSLIRRRFTRSDLSDSFKSQDCNSHRLHLRAHLCDLGEGAGCHFVAITSQLGTCALGMFSSDGARCSYGFLRGFGAHFPEPHVWRSAATPRAKGWHVLELVLQDMELFATIDDEPVAKWTVDGSESTSEEHVWFGASGSPCAAWGGVELLHTPVGHGTWEVGVQDLKPANRRPWRILCQEEGTWELDASSGKVTKTTGEESKEPRGEGPRQHTPEPQEAAASPGSAELGLEDGLADDMNEAASPPRSEELSPRLEDSLADDANEAAAEPSPDADAGDGGGEGADAVPGTAGVHCEEPPVPPRQSKATLKRPKAQPRPKSRGAARSASPGPGAPDPPRGLVIDCWTRPGETELQRLDRAVRIFLGKLQEAGVAMPSNIKRIEECLQPEHESCYVYSFGTRRLHIATREGDAGRITVVVRIGGGFIDFLDFVRRNGSLEKLRFERRPDSRGREHVRLCSVMSNGRVQVKDMAGAAPARPGDTARPTLAGTPGA